MPTCQSASQSCNFTRQEEQLARVFCVRITHTHVMRVVSTTLWLRVLRGRCHLARRVSRALRHAATLAARGGAQELPGQPRFCLRGPHVRVGPRSSLTLWPASLTALSIDATQQIGRRAAAEAAHLHTASVSRMGGGDWLPLAATFRALASL